MGLLYLFCLLVVSDSSFCLSVVKVEVIIIVEVALDGVEIYENVVELFQQKETRSHALTTVNRV